MHCWKIKNGFNLKCFFYSFALIIQRCKKKEKSFLTSKSEKSLCVGAKLKRKCVMWFSVFFLPSSFHKITVWSKAHCFLLTFLLSYNCEIKSHKVWFILLLVRLDNVELVRLGKNYQLTLNPNKICFFRVKRVSLSYWSKVGFTDFRLRAFGRKPLVLTSCSSTLQMQIKALSNKTSTKLDQQVKIKSSFSRQEIKLAEFIYVRRIGSNLYIRIGSNLYVRIGSNL
jgi:hypothetical protein